MEKEFIHWERYGKDLQILGDLIKHSGSHFDCIYALPRGGLPVAVYLSHYLDIESIVTTPLQLIEAWSHQRILLVDDLVDTGETLTREAKRLDALRVIYEVAALYRKDETILNPNYCVRTINKWVVFPYELD